MILLDTDHLSVLLDLRHKQRQRLVDRLDGAGEELAVPIICVEELLRGWLAQIRRTHDPHRQVAPYQRLAKLLDFLRDWRVIAWDQSAADVFVQRKSAKLKIGAADLQMAAIVLASGARLLSANLVHFQQVVGPTGRGLAL